MVRCASLYCCSPIASFCCSSAICLPPKMGMASLPPHKLHDVMHRTSDGFLGQAYPCAEHEHRLVDKANETEGIVFSHNSQVEDHYRCTHPRAAPRPARGLERHRSYGSHSSAPREVRLCLGYRNTRDLSILPQTSPKRVQHRRYGACSSRIPMRRTVKRSLFATNKERVPLPGVLTVDYFTTSPGGNPAPRTRISNVLAHDARTPPCGTVVHQLASTHGPRHSDDVC